VLKRIFTHSAIYGLAPQISKVANFFVLPIITKDLTEIDYGVSGIVIAYTSSISVLSALGLRLILVNSFYKSPGQYKWAWRQIYGFLTIWNLFYAFILSALIYLIIPEVAYENRWWILILNVGPIIFFGQTSTIATTFYQLKRKPLSIGIRTGIFGILSVLFNLYFISVLKMGYMGWFLSAFIVGMLSNVSYWYPLNFIIKMKPIFNFKWRFIKNSIKVSAPTIPHYYSGYLLNSSDKMVMDLVQVGTGEIGKYNIAYTVGNMMKIIGNATGLAVGPFLNEFFKSKDEKSARSLIFLLQISFFIITFTLCIWLKEIFYFLIRNETLREMYYLGVVIVMSYNYRPMYIGSSAKLMYEEKTNILWRISLLAGILNVILNVIFIPFIGFEFAAFSTFVSFMYMGYSGYFFNIFKEVNTLNYFPSRWIVTTILLTILVYYIVEWLFIAKMIISIITILLGFFIINRIQQKIQH
jgi:O-antigen/teichoic acid export membrane protein